MTVRQIGGCTLYHGDCAEVLAMMQPVDLIATDPPYGIGQANGFAGIGAYGRFGNGTTKIQRRSYEGEWDNVRPDKAVFDLMLAKSKTAIIFGGNYFTDYLPQSNHWLVWDKLNTMPSMSDCELAWTNIKRNSVRRLVYNNNGLGAREKDKHHPSQKPVDVMGWALSQVPKAVSVCDPFMGSGSTGIAAIKAGKAFVGIERDLNYFEVACKRIRDALAAPDLFVPAYVPPVQEVMCFD